MNGMYVTDGETEKTVNVLLNGEETALAFVEGTEHEDDASDTVAACMIVYACDDRTSFDRAVDMLYNLRQKEMRKNVIFLVGNKSDLVRSRCITTEEAKAVAMTYDCKFVETSVVLNVNVDELLVGIVKQLHIRSANYDDDDKSTGCASSSKSLLTKIFKKHNISKSCENLYS
ncbi:GTP-binding protein REM 1-like [Mercenaria mercenaria]|uniref:GTP-binding protein REM 1-like n=1 Tax=Mercenaria mercenaria TaxID=6596 RepID=UPI00234F7508|nr:GTP-binding protein REM 1-like [Mercenaria mercenaria]